MPANQEANKQVSNKMQWLASWTPWSWAMLVPSNRQLKVPSKCKMPSKCKWWTPITNRWPSKIWCVSKMFPHVTHTLIFSQTIWKYADQHYVTTLAHVNSKCFLESIIGSEKHLGSNIHSSPIYDVWITLADDGWILTAMDGWYGNGNGYGCKNVLAIAPIRLRGSENLGRSQKRSRSAKQYEWRHQKHGWCFVKFNKP